MIAAEPLVTRLGVQRTTQYGGLYVFVTAKGARVDGGTGDLALLVDPVSQELLYATNLARLAYTWGVGTPRVVPI